MGLLQLSLESKKIRIFVALLTLNHCVKNFIFVPVFFGLRVTELTIFMNFLLVFSPFSKGKCSCIPSGLIGQFRLIALEKDLAHH